MCFQIPIAFFYVSSTVTETTETTRNNLTFRNWDAVEKQLTYDICEQKYSEFISLHKMRITVKNIQECDS